MTMYANINGVNVLLSADEEAVILASQATARAAAAAAAAAAAVQATYAAAIAAGCQIISTGMPALNGIYSIDPVSTADIMAEVQSFASFGTFTNGASSLIWPIAGGAVTFTSQAQLLAIAKTLAAYVTGWKQYAGGLSPSGPTTPVTIP